MEDQLPQFYTLGPLAEFNFYFFSLPSYYTVISLTYCLCIFWFYKRCEKYNLPQDKAMDLGMIILLSGFVGARLFHIILEAPSYYLSDPVKIFYFWQGGFVFYGGLLTSYLAAYLYARKQPKNFLGWHDALAPVLALGYALGRTACFMTGCCFGKVCQLPWATSVKQVDIQTHTITEHLRHPTQLYATGLELFFLAIILWLEKKSPKPGILFFTWLLLHACGRIFMEIFRDDPRGGTLFGLSVSTIISLALILIASRVLFKSQTNEA